MALLPALLALLLARDIPPAEVRATVWVRAGDRANGTGWVVDASSQWAVTAGHVVGDRETVEVYFLDCPLNHPITNRRHYITDRAGLHRRGLVAVGRVICRRDSADLALLALDRLPAAVPALPLSATPTSPCDACRSIGHRHDADHMWNLTAGRVRQVGRLPNGYFWAGRRIGAGVPLALLQAPIEAGESGSAVLNDAGQVIGMVSAVVNQGAGSALAIDVSEIRSLLADARKGLAPVPQSPKAPKQADARALAAATVWANPRATNGRAAGVLIDSARKLVLTSATAVGTVPVVDVIAPRWDGGRIVPEADAYRDLLGLRLSGQCVGGMVLARDLDRDLALVELDDVPQDLLPVILASGQPRMGERVASMGHPPGIELLWLYSGGAVRSVGSVPLGREQDRQSKVRASLLQLPHEAGTSGSPVVNASGELVGVVASHGAVRQDLAYAVTPDEIRAVLNAARPLWDPQTSGAWVTRGRLAERLNRPAAALAAFRRANEIAPNDPVVLVGHAALLAGAGQRPQALRLAEAAVAQRPASSVLAELAAVFMQIGHRDRAARLVEQALRADPRSVAALVLRARLQSGKAAMEDVSQALQFDPASASAYRVRAGLWDQTTTDGRRQAIADWNRVLELTPTDLEALAERARLLMTVNEPKKAVADWARLTELEPVRADYWTGLAQARFATGDRAGAAEALRSALRVEPGRMGEVFGLVRGLGNELRADNPRDRARAAEWDSLTLDRLAVWLPK